MKNSLLIFIFFISTLNFYSQITKENNLILYQFVILDQSENYSMYQFNQNYLSSYRIASRMLDDTNLKRKYSESIKLIYSFIIGMPLTHEEGHRSVLTHLGIGSISQPFFNSKGAAYVKGVTDETLKNLRDTDLSDYIRLHTAGLESDYMMQKKSADLLVFEEDNFSVLKAEYFVRKLSPLQYHLTTFIPKMMPDLKEEENELKRDIVGHDIWGMVRHLYRPQMEFYRYTQFDDLTGEEKKYAKKLAFKSFTNLIDPILIGKKNFKINENLKINASLGHSLSPFGDYLDQNFWLFYQDKYKFSGYVREYFNRENTFLSGGISLHHLDISDHFQTSAHLNIWKQPENLSFNASNSFIGAGFDTQLYYKFYYNPTSKIKTVGLFTDIYYKSKGFLPEYSSLEKDFGLRFGFGFSY